MPNKKILRRQQQNLEVNKKKKNKTLLLLLIKLVCSFTLVNEQKKNILKSQFCSSGPQNEVIIWTLNTKVVYFAKKKKT